MAIVRAAGDVRREREAKEKRELLERIEKLERQLVSYIVYVKNGEENNV